MEDVAAPHAEIRRLRALAGGTTDVGALAAILELIHELKHRAGDLNNGWDGEEAS
jgi:hypothetical protein